MTWDKEAVYDDLISPLMARIIEICKEHEIPFVAQFQIGDSEEDGPLFCTSAMASFERTCPHIRDLARRVAPIAPPVVLAETVETRPDGSKHITIRQVR